MIRKSIVLYCIAFIFANCSAQPKSVTKEDQDLKLELVQLLFRHGARTPLDNELEVYSYLNRSVYDSWGIGILTTRGKLQEYEFGKLLRQRYDGFLKADYLADEVYAYTSNNDRTKQTLNLILAGLYPPIESKVWNSELKWSPIPYYYTPIDLDVLLKYYDGPTYMQLINEAQRSPKFKAQISKHSKFLEFLTNKTGITFDENIKNVQDMYGVLASNKNMNLTLPDWFTPEVEQNFIKVLETVFDSYSFTEKMRKLHPGPLIKTFIENMNLNGTYFNPRKIYLYSGHDGNVAAFIRAHKIQEFRYTKFGDGIVFEKFRDSQDKVYVRMLAYTSEKKKFTPLKLAGHEEFCPIEDYLELVSPVVQTDEGIDQMLAEFDFDNLKHLLYKDDAVKEIH